MPICRDLCGGLTGLIRTAAYCEKTDVLGPGQRFVLWVQGCTRGCPGCIAPEMQPLDGGNPMQITALAARIPADSDGITVSGGEPFYQAGRIAELLALLRRDRPDFSVIVFTGYRYDVLKNAQEPGVSALLAQTDLLIDGEYVKALDDDAPMRGSSNQQLHFLTDRIQPAQLSAARQNQVLLSGGSMRIIGIPSAATKAYLSSIRYRFGPE